MATAILDNPREQMLRCLDAGHAYEFLTVAAPYLHSCPDDAYVRLMVLREYLKLGLITPARELLDSGSTAIPMTADLDAIRLALANATDAPVSWSDHAECFERNLAALTARGIDVATVAEAWSSQKHRYQLFRDNRGCDQVRMRGDDGLWQWIPGLFDHKAIADTQPPPPDIASPTPGPYLFEGLDLGHYFQRIYDATRDTFLGFSCALFVVEPDPAAFAIPLHLNDWRDLLSDPRVLVFLGGACTRSLRQAWESDFDLPFPCHAFAQSRFRPPPTPTGLKAAQEAGRRRETEIKDSYTRIESQYAERDGAFWAKRFDDALSGRGEPLRILAAVSSHTTFLKYSMRDAKQAFESLGHRCRVLTENTSYATIGPLSYHNAIRDFDPDLFFNIDHLRPEFPGIVPPNLPVFTWDQDQLPQVFTEANIKRLSKLDFVAGWSKLKCIIAGCNPQQLLYARVPTCPAQFSGDALTEKERARYSCDVSFVSHASQTPQAFHEEERSGYKDTNVQRLLDAMFEMTPPLVAQHGVMRNLLALSILDEASRRCGLEVRDATFRDRMTTWYLWRLADRIFRHQALSWVADWARARGTSFRIYGNGWDKHPTLSPFAAGPAENGRELLCIYRASAINLQIMPSGFVHQRALDGLSAGGFFLGRKTPADVHGRAYRKLDQRIRELDISTTRELLACPDAEVQQFLTEALGVWRERIDPDDDTALANIGIVAELVHPDEVFNDFNDVLFDSAAEFASKADHFLAGAAHRRTKAQEMREVVIKNYGYRPAMDHFLRTMAAYLRATFG